MRLFTLIILIVHLDRYDISFDIKIKRLSLWLVASYPFSPMLQTHPRHSKHIPSTSLAPAYRESMLHLCLSINQKRHFGNQIDSESVLNK